MGCLALLSHKCLLCQLGAGCWEWLCGAYSLVWLLMLLHPAHSKCLINVSCYDSCRCQSSWQLPNLSTIWLVTCGKLDGWGHVEDRFPGWEVWIRPRLASSSNQLHSQNPSWPPSIHSHLISSSDGCSLITHSDKANKSIVLSVRHCSKPLNMNSVNFYNPTDWWYYSCFTDEEREAWKG